MHLVKHDGYDIACPRIPVSAFTHLIRTDGPDQAKKGLKVPSSILEPGVSQVTDYIERVSCGDGSNVVHGPLGEIGNGEVGVFGLRQLKSCLIGSERDRTLGTCTGPSLPRDTSRRWLTFLSSLSCIEHIGSVFQIKGGVVFVCFKLKFKSTLFAPTPQGMSHVVGN
ncbi:MAG: hypothetical protein J3Q66DRAFT_365884 [Benniella sp.]|nr:MAG: hypothetical protein J3Q66DRAFT_365884 [Benniella sp.]